MARRLTTANTVRSLSKTLRVRKPMFKSLKECSTEEWQTVCREYETGVMQKTADRMIALIEAQRGEDKRFGFAVDLYEHALQTATRAFKDGASEELVIAALFHDAAEYVSPHNHGQVIGQMLLPYVSPQTFWILSHHDLFQSYYYLHHYGMEPDALSKKYCDHEHYDATVHFCEHWDQAAFDANYACKELQFFKPMIDRFFAQQPFWWNDGVNPLTGMGSMMDLNDFDQQ